jgi:AcrR family transcriptional regulator
MASPTPTRDRLVEQGMRLFAERGYAAASVADIEAAAGLSAGSGSLYRHFPSKEALLAEGIRRRIADGNRLMASLQSGSRSAVSLVSEAAGVVRAGLARLEAERDLNLIMLRDLKQFPELVAEARDDELARTHQAVTAWVEARSVGHPVDADALAAIVVGATAHYWLLRDIFGEHPSGVPEDSFVATLAQITAQILTGDQADDSSSA